MNGGHDLGGAHGFGPVRPEADEPIFHADWEARALALTLAAGALGRWNIDVSRHARESLHPPLYQTAPYYGIWTLALGRLLEGAGMVTRAEIANGRAETPRADVAPALDADAMHAALLRGGPSDRPATTEPAHAPGDAVTTINEHPDGHTRLPRYARGRRGRIERVLGHHVFADARAAGRGEEPHWLYRVRFDATELWGSRAVTGDAVTLDLWEPHLLGG